MTLGKKIAACRKQAGLSQEELAQRLCISRQAVSRWETGAALPDIEKVIQLSRMFGVSTDFLLLEDVQEQAGAASAQAPLLPMPNPVTERRRRFRIAFGTGGFLSGCIVGVAALFLTQLYADGLSEWQTNLGKFGTALLHTWRIGMLTAGILLALVGAAVLVREYIRKD